MRAKNITESQLRQALANVNNEQGYKLIFNREPEKVGNFLHFTIRSERSKIPGSSISWSGRNSPSASWHSHGYLFDAMLAIAPEVIIKTAFSSVDAQGGNWQDFQVGSMMNPSMASEGSIL